MSERPRLGDGGVTGGADITGRRRFAAGLSDTKGVVMQVLIERSNVGSDVRCEVCGQGFIVYWDWASRQARVAAQTLVTSALREQHEDVTTGHHVHPEERFAIPERRSVARMPGMKARVDIREEIAA